RSRRRDRAPAAAQAGPGRGGRRRPQCGAAGGDGRGCLAAADQAPGRSRRRDRAPAAAQAGPGRGGRRRPQCGAAGGD
ncbi:hypothetical protein C7E13_21985, partial [Stenotrophomonas maltophilia]